MRLGVFGAFVLGVALAGCGPQSEQAGPAEPAIEQGDQLTFRGRLVWGHEVRSFQECESEIEGWVIDATGGDVRRIYETLASQPYQALFVEVRATRGPPPETGFGADYDHALTVTEVRRAEAEGRGCTEDFGDLEFRAFGVEPFWSLVIKSSGLALSRPDPAGAGEWPNAEANVDGGIVRYRSVNAAGDDIEVEIRESRCIDAMAGSHFAFEAEVRLPEETLRGCALEGDASHASE